MSTRVEMWGGIESTINRIGDRYYEQMNRSGHKYRLTDLDLLVESGFKAIRYPVLMEQLAPRSPEEVDFSWPDLRVPYLNSKGVKVIAGLLHHGSGPLYTSLHDEQFPQKVATYAREVARHYPWLEHYTPVNEPNTTARFSGLYGLWYPHTNTAEGYAKALLNQCKATVLAMRAVREINSDAKLVQTEDVGHTVALDPKLRYQADHENVRRFITFDLLTGRFDKNHPLWYYFSCLADEADLLWFRDNPMPPDIFGVNYYVTSERALDARTELYPDEMAGGNGRDEYVDIELVRIGDARGYLGILSDVWERYRASIAITEAHLNCTMDEQMRWLKSAWDSAVNLKKSGVDIKAVTSWAVFGSFDWNSLLCKYQHHYENGVFDVSGDGLAKPTQLFDMVRALSEKGEYEHPIFEKEGWWERDDRIIYPFHGNNLEQI